MASLMPLRWLVGITDVMDMNGQISGVGEGQKGLACSSPWGCKDSDMTGQLNSNNNNNVDRLLKELAKLYSLLWVMVKSVFT